MIETDKMKAHLALKNGIFSVLSVDKDVTVISDSSSPGQLGRRRIPAPSGRIQAAATPCSEH